MSKFGKETDYDDVVEEVRNFPDYSNQELRVFEKEMEAYRVNKTDARGAYTYIDLWKYLQDKGAVKNNAIQVTGFKYLKCHLHKDCSYPTCDQPLYEVINDKWNQLCKLQGRTEFAQKKAIEGYEEIAQSVGDSFRF